MMCTAIDNPTSCEIHAVTHFIYAAEIHRELYAVEGQNITREGILRQWWEIFKDMRKMYTSSEVVGRPSVVIDGLVQSVDQQSVKDGSLQFQNFRMNFHKFHILFSTRLSQLG
jgi:hypothetical protein